MIFESFTLYSQKFSVQLYGDHGVRLIPETSSPNLPRIAEELLRSGKKSIKEVIACPQEILVLGTSPKKLMTALAPFRNVELSDRIPNSYTIPLYLNPEEGLEDFVELDLLFSKLEEQKLELAMFGFLPGFLYLSGIDSEFQLPRKSTPSKSCPPRSIALGGEYVGTYNFSSPAGWHILGQTPIDIPVEHEDLRVGDQFKIKLIDQSVYQELLNQDLNLIQYNARD